MRRKEERTVYNNFKIIRNCRIILQIPKIFFFGIQCFSYILSYGYFYMNMINIFIIVIIKEHKKHILYNTYIEI